jgi:Tol biopolymer transport system component
LIENVVVNAGGAAQVAVADNGTMAYRSGKFFRKVMLVDRRGSATTLVNELHDYAFPSVSPDGQRIALTIGSATLASDVWIFDTRTGALTRLTRGRSERAEWTPDGRGLLTVRQDTTAAYVAEQSSDGSGAPSTYAATERGILEISLPRRHTGFLAARVGSGAAQRDIWIAPIDSPSTLRPFVATEADEISPAVSPDGQWLAYVSNESGRYEVYLRSMTGAGGRVQLSTNGAVEPVWSPTGRELFYRAERKIVAAKITWQDSAAHVQREALFDDVYASNGTFHATYSVMPDGEHFVFLQSAGGEPKTVVVLNWFEDVRRRMAAAGGR